LGLLATTVLWAQEAGVKGRVLSKMGRTAVENARVCLYQGADLVEETRSDKKGNFLISGIQGGDYTLIILATEFLENHLSVNVQEGKVKNLYNIVLHAVYHVGADQPEVLFGSTDIVNSLVRQDFPQLRYGGRGLREREYYLAGVHLAGDAVARSGLFEAFRENRTVEGSSMDDVFGGLNGTTSIDGTAGSFRSGLYTSLTTNNALAHLWGQASYSTGNLPGGWVISADASVHTSDLSPNPSAQLAAGYLGADKIFSPSSRLSAAFLYSATPLAFVRYTYTPSRRTRAFVTALGELARGSEQLHLSGGINSQLSKHWTLQGGLDSQLSLVNVENRQLEAWAGAAYLLRRWSFQMAFQSQAQRLGEYSWLNWQGKTSVHYYAGNTRLWASVGGFQLSGVQRFRWAGDLNWSYNTNGINVRATAYAITRDDGLGYGAELGFKLPVLIVPNLSLQGLACMGSGRYLSGGLCWSKGASFASADVLDNNAIVSLLFKGGHTWTLGRSILGLSAGLKTQLSAVSTLLPRWNYLIRLTYRI
jgi:hypothetical protein